MSDINSHNPASPPPTSHERIDRQRVLGRLRAALLGQEDQPRRIGDRYIIDKRLGRGASGAVFSAQDERLKRRVALKLVHIDGSIPAKKLTDRINREAQTLARLSHENVVQIYDVGQYGDGLFIAMEFIDGESLEQWQRGKHEWSKIVDVYCKAGEGLAEAHRHEIVHQDFKPGNVLRGRDGKQICVADFGLARLMNDEMAITQHDEGQPASEGLIPTWTVGYTPVYAAPEQMTGQAVDDKSDQYAFCVSLFEALYGELPFRGDRLEKLLWNKQEGHIVPHEQGTIPSRVVQALERGLDPDPAQRHPSMTSLLAELRPRGRWPKGRNLGVALAVMFGAGVTVASLGRDDTLITEQSIPCSGYGDLAERGWNPEARQRILEAFTRSGHPQAETIAATVSRDLDVLHARWQDEATDACIARWQTEDSETGERTLESERSQCLETRRREAGLLIERLSHADLSMVDQAFDLVARLRPLDSCAAREITGAEISTEQLEALDSELSAAHVAISLGDWKAAALRAEAARKRAHELGLETREIEARIDLGRARLELGDELGIDILERASRRAEEIKDDRLAWLGWVSLAQRAFGVVQERERARECLARAETALTRLGDEGYRRMRLNFERANLKLVQGTEAVELLEQVWRGVQVGGPGMAELQIATGTTLSARLLETEDPSRATPYALATIALSEKRKGAGHPDTIKARVNLGMALLDECRLADAEHQLARATADGQTLSADHGPLRFQSLMTHAQIHFFNGHPERARPLLAQMKTVSPAEGAGLGQLELSKGALAFAEGRLDEAADHFAEAATAFDHPVYVALARSMVAESRLHLGNVEQALALAEEASGTIEQELGPTHPLGAISMKVAGLAALYQGRLDVAAQRLERARAMTSACDGPELADIDYGLGVALAREGQLEEGHERQGLARDMARGFGALGMARLGRLEKLLVGPG